MTSDATVAAHAHAVQIHALPTSDDVALLKSVFRVFVDDETFAALGSGVTSAVWMLLSHANQCISVQVHSCHEYQMISRSSSGSESPKKHKSAQRWTPPLTWNTRATVFASPVVISDLQFEAANFPHLGHLSRFPHIYRLKSAERLVLLPTQSAHVSLLPPPALARNVLLGRPVRGGETVRLPLASGKFLDFSISVLPTSVWTRVNLSTRVAVDMRMPDISCHPEKILNMVHPAFRLLKEALARALCAQPPSETTLGPPAQVILLHGPAGCGKSFAVPRIVESLNAFCLRVTACDLYTSFAGEAYRGLQQKWCWAVERAPAVVVIDDAQIMFPSLDDGSLDHALCAQFEQITSALQRQTGTCFVLVSNNPTKIHARVRRRIVDTIEISKPDPTLRAKILQQQHCPQELIDHCAELTAGFSGAQVVELLAKAGPVISRESLSEICHQMRLQSKLHGVSGQETAKKGWERVGGMFEIKRRLEESVVWLYEKAELFKQLSFRAQRGVLLYGPPGTGKTLLARAVAEESRAAFLSLSVPELIRSEVGESERLLRQVFSRARALTPCIVFFDEVQALFGSRDDDTGSNVERKLVTQLVLELDALEQCPGVLVLAATNRPDMIDSSLLRSGRFEEAIFVPAPDEQGRLEILHVLAKTHPIEANLNFDDIAKRTNEFSGADLANLFRNAGLAAAHRLLPLFAESGRQLDSFTETVQISVADFNAALQITKPSVSSFEMNMLRNWAHSREQHQ